MANTFQATLCVKSGVTSQFYSGEPSFFVINEGPRLTNVNTRFSDQPLKVVRPQVSTFRLTPPLFRHPRKRRKVTLRMSRRHLHHLGLVLNLPLSLAQRPLVPPTITPPNQRAPPQRVL